jgi:hypothetical protein
MAAHKKDKTKKMNCGLTKQANITKSSHLQVERASTITTRKSDSSKVIASLKEGDKLAILLRSLALSKSITKCTTLIEFQQRFGAKGLSIQLKCLSKL